MTTCSSSITTYRNCSNITKSEGIVHSKREKTLEQPNTKYLQLVKQYFKNLNLVTTLLKFNLKAFSVTSKERAA